VPPSVRRLVASCIAASLVGCSALLGYPPPAPETGPAACHNGADDDFDGSVDCNDRDCAGQCRERGEAPCANGLDDDGDGLVDPSDPECWPLGAIAVDRDCVEVSGTMPTTDWSRTAVTASPLVYPDTTGGAPRYVFPSDTAGFIVGDDVLTGDLGDTTLTVDIVVVPNRWFEVGLLFDGREAGLALGTALGIGIVVLPGISAASSVLGVTNGGRREAISRDVTPFGITHEEHLRVVLVTQSTDRGPQIASVTIEGASGPPFMLNAAARTIDASLVARGMRVYARAEAGTGEVSVNEITVRRGALRRCAVEDVVRTRQPALDHRVLAATTRLDADGREIGLCAIVATTAPETATTRLVRMVTDGCGQGLWHEIDTAAISSVERGASAAALARTPDGDLVAAIGFAVGEQLALSDLAEIRWTTPLGPGCESHDWELEPGAVPADALTIVGEGHADRRTTALGLVIESDGTRRLTLIDRDDSHPVEATFAPGATLVASSLRAGLVDAGDIDAILGMGIGSLRGNPIWATRRTSGEIVLVVEGARGMSEAIPLFTPGEPPGTFDAAGGGFPTFVPFDPDGACAANGIGVLLEGGLPGDPAVTAIRTAVFPVTFTPPAEAPVDVDAGLTP
jgi:hypothetical protein